MPEARAEVASSRHLSWLAVGALVAINLVPLVGVLAWGWKLEDVLLLYWFENVAIGLASAVKLGMVARRAGFVLVPFFLLHFGLFAFVHLLFLIGLLHFGRPEEFSVGTTLGTFLATHRLVALGLLASHASSFVLNYLGRAEYRGATVHQAMVAPYRRVVVMHLTLFAAGLGVALLGTPAVGLAVMVLLKVAVDLRGHLRERRRA